MANLNRIVLVGRLVADPESRVTVDGLPVTKFRLAVNRPTAGGGTGTDFIDVVSWRRLAEICGQHLKKGQLTLIEGRIQNRAFEDQTGQKRWVTEVVARSMTRLEAPAGGVETPVNEETVEDADLASDLPF